MNLVFIFGFWKEVAIVSIGVLPAGKRFELAVLGSLPHSQSEYKRLFGRRRSAARKEKAYGFYNDQLTLMISADERLLGTWDRWPTSRLARRMFWLVARKFTLVERRCLRMCNTTHSSFDHDHGVDLVFSYRGAKATVDLAIYVKDKLKADFLVIGREINGEFTIECRSLEAVMEDVVCRLRNKPFKLRN